MTREEAIRRLREHGLADYSKTIDARRFMNKMVQTATKEKSCKDCGHGFDSEDCYKCDKNIQNTCEPKQTATEEKSCETCTHKNDDFDCHDFCVPYDFDHYKVKEGESMEEVEYEDFSEEIPKKKTFWIHDMDITFDEELTHEEMEKRFYDALRNAGVIGHRGCPN